MKKKNHSSNSQRDNCFDSRKPQRNLLLNFQYSSDHHQSFNYNRNNWHWNSNGGRTRQRRSSSSAAPLIPKTHSRYVLANYFFSLRPINHCWDSQVYQELISDPDPDITQEEIWSLIECVSIPIVVPNMQDKNSEEYKKHFPRCPICLEQPPICARVAQCGHVFCYTCLMRYLSHAEEHHVVKSVVEKKCPVCTERVTMDTCKSVEWRVKKEVKEGQILNFHLVKRPKDCLVPSKVFHHKDHAALNSEHAAKKSELLTGERFPVYGEHDMELSKFVIASDAHMQNLFDREMNELQFAIETMQSGGPIFDQEELSFLKVALRELERRKFAWHDFMDKNKNWVESSTHIGEGQAEQDDSIDNSQECEKVSGSLQSTPKTTSSAISAEYEAFGSDDEEDNQQAEESYTYREEHHESDEYESDSNSDDDDFVGSPDEYTSRMQGKKGKEAHHIRASQYHKSNHLEFDSYYYYQAADNQMVFLHPLNTRCLIHEHQGDFDQFPESIRAKIIQVEHTELTDDLRRKIGVLSHVPLYCQFTFVEVDLLYNKYISSATRKHFASDFLNREKERREAMRRRAREDKKAQKQEQEEKLKRIAQMEERRTALSLDSFPEIEPTESVMKSDHHFPAPKATPVTNRSGQKKKSKNNSSQIVWGVQSIVNAPPSGLGSSSSPKQELQGHWKTRQEKITIASSSSSITRGVSQQVTAEFPALSRKSNKNKK